MKLKSRSVHILLGFNGDGKFNIETVIGWPFEIPKRPELCWCANKLMTNYGVDNNLWQVSDMTTGCVVYAGAPTRDEAIAGALELASGLFPDVYKRSCDRLQQQVKEHGIIFPLNVL